MNTKRKKLNQEYEKYKSSIPPPEPYRYTYTVSYWDNIPQEEINEGKRPSFLEVLNKMGYKNIEEYIKDNIAKLPLTEKRVMEMRLKGFTWRVIGQAFNRSESWARKKYKSAINQLSSF